MSIFKRLFCKHDYVWLRNIYGDEIIYCGYKKSIWKCPKCGALQYRDKLYLENEMEENKVPRLSDLSPIKIEPTNDEERYILEEAKLYLDETGFSSIWGPNKHVDNVIALGKKNTKFLIDFLRENNHPQGMYSHFLIDVLFGLYKDEIKVEGYLGVDGCVKGLIYLYDNGILELDKNKIYTIEDE